MGPTHESCQNLRYEGGPEPMTLQRLINTCLRYGSFREGTLCIDDANQIHVRIWHWLTVLKRFPVSFSVMGDD